jgi:transcriptional regulator with PAS, ATPase and Fis domain
LYYRLNVIRIHLPPLRDRRQDIPLLANTFLKEIAPQKNWSLPVQDMQKMLAYPWPGNVRELRNVIERAILQRTADGGLQLSALIPETPGRLKPEAACATGSSIQTLSEIENQYIRSTLDKLDNNLTRTAKALGISLNTLKKKLTDA